jgi:hypothetical protein
VYSNLAWRAFFSFSSLCELVVKVDGSIPGNNFKATGNNISINGTMTKTEKGTNRNKSCVKRDKSVRTL